jgi:hypothetical protein
MTDLERLQRTLQWLDIVASETIELVTNDHIFWEVQDIIGANRKLRNAESVFFKWLSSTFAHSAAAAVRRQASLNDKSVSLHRLLDELRKFPHLISREYHRSLYAHHGSKYLLEGADKIYDEYVGDLRNCLLELDELVRKYLLLMKAEHKITLLPTFLYDWKSIFRLAWINNDESVGPNHRREVHP